MHRRTISYRKLGRYSRGFTLIEMLVIAPIVILSIGAFIALIINLTGEVMSSRGSNTLAYDVQDALNRIEQDVKLSTGFLAYNNIDFDATNGVQSFDDGASTAKFENTGNGTGPMLILSGLVTTDNPTSLSSANVYLKDQPNDCSDPLLYMKNRPMTMNIVYFVKDNALWRRTIMPSNYADSNARCGNPPWQQASCSYSQTSAFCATKDIRLIDNFSAIDFSAYYFTNASSNTPIADVNNASTDDEVRAVSLRSASTVLVSLTAQKTIAGRDFTRAGTLRATRLDINATSVAIPSAPSSAPAIPVVSSGTVSDGHNVTVTWQQVPTATAYDLQYRINGGAWQTPAGTQNITNNNRTYTITSGTHTDTVEVQVRSKNNCTSTPCESAWSASSSTTIPLWAPLILRNGWTKYGSPYAAAAYTKTRAGVVVLKGLIKSGALDSATATLPADYRPAAHLMFEASANSAACRFDVFSHGDISVTSACSNAWASLDSIRYLAPSAPVVASGNLTPQPAWKNFTVDYPTSGWTNASYAVDTLGRVHTRGLVSSGATADGTVIASLPAGLGPNGYLHIVNTSSNVNSLIGINTAGQLLAKGGPNVYQSIISLYLPSSCPSGATCSSWTSLPLESPWAQYAGYSPAQYTKSSDGLVMVKGLLQGGANQTYMANIPAGFCPKERLLMTSQQALAWGRVDVIPNNTPGTGCRIFGYNVSGTWTSLDTVSYIAEQ